MTSRAQILPGGGPVAGGAVSPSLAASPVTPFAEVVRSWLDYSPETGEFRWKQNNRKCRAGQIAGNLNNEGYRKIGLLHRNFLAHRLAWLIMTGDWPEGQIDHHNRDRADNRWDNLRKATPSQNRANSIRSRSLPKGVRKRPGGRFSAEYFFGGRTVHIGVFDTIELATAAHRSAAIAVFGEFARFE